MEKEKSKYPVILPQTPFPMKAELPKREPRFFEFWKKNPAKAKPQAPKFTLHDGPPYANGPIHIGHALNKILKDFVVRYKTMTGYDCTYVPGWDCHGLPIEQALLKELNISKKEAFADPVALRKKCREFVLKMMELQRKDFMRLGSVGEWDKPYITQELPYAAKIVEAFIALYKKGYIYKGKKPVFWCIYCETALAQAEIEYAQKTSPSIYVKFPSRQEKISALVWTTTPWTLPANRALAFDPGLDYVVVEVKKNSKTETWLLAQARLKAVAKELSLADYKIQKTLKGSDMKGWEWEHPLFIEGKEPLAPSHSHAGRGSRPSIVEPGVVSAEEGTGIVHIAPGHGDIDYKIGLANKLEIFSPVNEQGSFSMEVGRKELEGASIKADANKLVCQILNDYLAHQGQVQHSYPHCWRCKNPVIFRATDQWFLNMEHQGLRKKILETLEPENTTWLPEGSVERIKSMVENRPDWCLSRQRIWGAPVPILYCKGCGRVRAQDALFEEIIKKISKEGEDFWFDPQAEFLKPWGEKYPCDQCHCKELVKDPNILDVWLDSGISWFAVVEPDSRLQYPADLYLEGSDQHRGWFQTSLITAVALTGRAPYKTVFTNGWVLDDQGLAMHKSLGNVVSPQEIIEVYGADILRLWVAESGGFENPKISKNSMRLYGEHYRKIRNTLRYLLGALHGFKPGRDGKRYFEEMGPLEQWGLGNLSRMLEDVRAGYENYDYPRVVRSILEFAIHDLSNFYLDVSKDRLYTFKENDPARRSTQTVLWVTLHYLLVSIAPILPFTAEEAWQEMLKLLDIHGPIFLAGIRLDYPASVHQNAFPLACADWKEAEILKDAPLLLAIREKAHQQFDAMRKEGAMGSSLEAKLKIKASKKLYEALRKWEAHLRSIWIVSDVELEEQAREDDPQISVEKAPGNKCVRCWVYHASVGDNPQHPELCAKCIQVLFS